MLSLFGMLDAFLYVCARYFVWLTPLVVSVYVLATVPLQQAPRVIIAIASTTLLAVFLATVIKHIVSKPRLREGKFVSHDRYAFPSGHATGLACLTYIAYTQSFTLGLVTTALSLVVLFARVQVRVHDYKDILGGLFLGILVASSLFPTLFHFV